MPQPKLPEFVTFTGLDERTDVDRVVELSKRYPVEWGVLFSPKRAGLHPRYPSILQMERFVGRGLRLAGHLCGAAARAALTYGHGVDMDATQDWVIHGLIGFNRVQINYVPNPEVWPELRTDTGLPLGHWEAMRFARDTMHPVIVQHRTLTFPPASDLDLLFDKSGGRGESPKNWPRHPGGKRLVGYAGGLGPYRTAEALPDMDTAGPYWLDMEGGVRTADDWLCLDAAEQVLQQVYGEDHQR